MTSIINQKVVIISQSNLNGTSSPKESSKSTHQVKSNDVTSKIYSQIENLRLLFKSLIINYYYTYLVSDCSKLSRRIRKMSCRQEGSCGVTLLIFSISALLLAIFLLSSAFARTEFCVYPLNYSPVCGSDGVTHGNERCMKCLPNVKKVKNGPC